MVAGVREGGNAAVTKGHGPDAMRQDDGDLIKVETDKTIIDIF
jgi:hypothetical protein